MAPLNLPTDELLRQLFQASEIPLLITDARGRIVHANPAFARQCGYSLTELLGQTLRLLHSHVHEPGFFHQMWAALRAQGRWQGEIWNRHQSGQVYRSDLLITALAQGTSGPSCYLGMYIDDSHRSTSSASSAAATPMSWAQAIQPSTC